MLEVKIQRYNDLSNEEKENASNNGAGMKYASYIRVTHNDETILLESDAMEPEDARFLRDLSWIQDIIRRAYTLGRLDKEG
jgi:hypothetical protein